MTKFKIFPPTVLAFVSEKEDGSMKLKAGFEQEQNDANRVRFFKKMGIDPEKVVSVHLVHGNTIAVVDQDNWNERISDVDALITKEKSVFLSVTVADCLPIFLYDPEKEITGIVHAGWRGLEKRIIFHAIEKFIHLGSDPKNILAAIGPGIGACHFEVREDVLNAFHGYPEAIKEGKKSFVDLKMIAKIQLEKAGIGAENIEVNEECTFDSRDRYFSYRRDKPEIIQAMVAVIGRI